MDPVIKFTYRNYGCFAGIRLLLKVLSILPDHGIDLMEFIFEYNNVVVVFNKRIEKIAPSFSFMVSFSFLSSPSITPQ